MSALDEEPAPGVAPTLIWSPAWSVARLMMALRCLMSDPEVSSPADIDASLLYREDRLTYDAKNKEQMKLREDRELKARQDALFKEAERKDQEVEHAKQQEEMTAKAREESASMWRKSDEEETARQVAAASAALSPEPA